MNRQVSVALIVRDEERVLGRCLGSLQGAFDEIVVVDTGSRDGTRAVARRFTDRVYDFAWVNDFSSARQFAFEQATGDWVAWLDADDILRGGESVRRLAKDASPEVGAIYWPYVVDWDAYGNPTCRFWRERLVRNDGSYRWDGRVHEVLTTQRPWTNQYSDQVQIEHHPPARPAGHGARNLALLEAELQNYQGEPPARMLFYLAREYATAGQPERALEFFNRHLQRCTWGDERYQSMLQIAAIHGQLGCWDQAIDTLLQSLKVCPHWPDAYFALAQAYYFQKDWHKVLHWTQVGRAMPLPETLLFTNPMNYRFNWIIYYTNALYHLGELREALDWTRQALQICPGDAMHLQNLACFQNALRER